MRASIQKSDVYGSSPIEPKTRVSKLDQYLNISLTLEVCFLELHGAFTLCIYV